MIRERAGPDPVQGTADMQDAQLARFARRWPVVLRIVFVVLALLVWAAFVEDAAHERRLTLAAIAERDANLATAVEHYVVRVLRTTRAVHRLLGSLVLQGRADRELEEALADRLRANDVFHELGLCLPDGRVLPPPKPGTQLTPAVCQQVRARTEPDPEVSVLPPLGAKGALLVPLALGIDDADGRPHGVAVALTPASVVLGIMQSAVLRDGTAVVVQGHDGLPRAAWRSQGGHVADLSGFAAFTDLLRTESGETTIAGRTYLVSTRAVPDLGLRIRVATESDDALAAFRARRARLFALCLLVTFGLGAVYHLLARMHAEALARSRALQRVRADLQSLNARLDAQVQDRTAKLEQAYRDLETFSYAVAHDVRAPLAGIAGFAQALEPALAGVGDEKPRHYLRRIQANAAQMDELTRQLLELGRLTRAPLVRTEVDLGALALDVIARLREGTPGRDVRVEVAAGLVARGDRTLLRQVLENLLGNAWKFTARRDVAHIAFRRVAEEGDADDPVFVVEDDGDGFDSDQATGLFQPFRRMHGSDEFPGTGVGLAAVQRVVALHCGRVWCESRRGAGARFFFSLPQEGHAT